MHSAGGAVPLIGPIPDGSGMGVVEGLAIGVLVAAMAVALFPGVRRAIATLVAGRHQSRPAATGVGHDTGSDGQSPAGGSAVTLLAGVVAVGMAIALAVVLGLVVVLGVFPLLGFLWVPALGLGVAIIVVWLARRREWFTYGEGSPEA